jgi:hypothetical protein
MRSRGGNAQVPAAVGAARADSEQILECAQRAVSAAEPSSKVMTTSVRP